MGIITFDIETANIIDLGPGQDLDSFGPFDIAVAATHAVGGEERLWMSKSASGVPLPMMAPDAAQELLQYLESMQKLGHMLVAWNGLSFDMRWIGHAARDMPAARRVALKIYDPMFQFFKLKGFPVGLAKRTRSFIARSNLCAVYMYIVQYMYATAWLFVRKEGHTSRNLRNELEGQVFFANKCVKQSPCICTTPPESGPETLVATLRR
jgi:hypothetical protein